MIDHLLDLWAGDSTRFAPQPLYTVIEARSNLGGSDHHVRERRAPEHDALTLLFSPTMPVRSNAYHVTVLLLDFATRRLCCSQSMFKVLHEREVSPAVLLTISSPGVRHPCCLLIHQMQ